jgi:hypothetical protein
MGRWGGRGARDEWSEEDRKKYNESTAAKSKTQKSGGFNKAYREQKARKEAAESKEPYNIMNYVGRHGKDSGRWGGRPSDTAGARDAPDNRKMAAMRAFELEMEAKHEKDPVKRDQLRNEARKLKEKSQGRDGMATDPPVSEKQRRAMFAAREGKSNLGIPKKVGEEFVGKSK